MIEQSRNTLLFAKEVTANAQVNVVMSDQALVKQLQRELTTVENELREKDLGIEKLKKEVAILTLQRDIARSEVEEIRQVVNQETPMKLWAGLDAHYPKLRVRNSWDSKYSIPATPVSAVGLRSCSPSDIHSCSSEESFLYLPDFKLHTPHPSSSTQLSPELPDFLASNLCLQEDNGEHGDENSEALCKEVHCIESGKRNALLYDLQNEGFSRNVSQSSSTSATVYEHKTQISRNESRSSLTSAAGMELKARNIPTPEEQQNASFCDSIGGTEETSDLKYEKQPADHAVQVTEPVLPGKTVNGLDPIPDNDGSSSAWLSEFKRLQKEIIELWHACNVSLVHRTYFFLLFKGDPKDYIYMEVENRRLSFLKNVFSHGYQTVENGRVVTPASSVKALRRQRHMLSQRIRKRLSKVERENLFQKWGIGLNTKHRGLQLANNLWIDPKDMNHVAESAAIVAKLVGFEDPEKTFKEMFGLNFTPGQRAHKRQCSLKHDVMSI